MKIIAFYSDLKLNNDSRIYSMSSKPIIDYISEKLNYKGIAAEIISPSWTDSSKGWYKGKKIKIDNSKTLITGPTFGTSNKALKIVQMFLSWLWLIFYLLQNTKKNEELIVYHVTNLMIPILFVKYLRKFKIILYTGELYQKVYKMPEFEKKIEDFMIKSASKYILSTELLNSAINYKNKPYVVLSGPHNINNKFSDLFSDSKIHIVYAGKINTSKGALTAVKASRFLNENYHIHIIGDGKEEALSELLKIISSIDLEDQGCRVTYDGVLKGNNYLQFIQSCQIGLSVQDVKASYNMTSFPSKIFSYLSNGIRVVTTELESIKSSSINELMYYSKSDDPEDIANTILNIDLNSQYNCSEFLRNLDEQFSEDLIAMIENDIS